MYGNIVYFPEGLLAQDIQPGNKQPLLVSTAPEQFPSNTAPYKIVAQSLIPLPIQSSALIQSPEYPPSTLTASLQFFPYCSSCNMCLLLTSSHPKTDSATSQQLLHLTPSSIGKKQHKLILHVSCLTSASEACRLAEIENLRRFWMSSTLLDVLHPLLLKYWGIPSRLSLSTGVPIIVFWVGWNRPVFK